MNVTIIGCGIAGMVNSLLSAKRRIPGNCALKKRIKR